MKKVFLSVIISLAGFSAGIELYAQGTTYNYFYRVYFKDKGNLDPINFSPDELLSQRAISRRKKSGISVPVFSDLPVNPDYINQVALKDSSCIALQNG